MLMKQEIYIILLLILEIIPFILLFVAYKNFEYKEVFFLKSLSQIEFEKVQLENEVSNKQDQVLHLEEELVKSRESILPILEKSDRLYAENQALRKVIEELQSQKNSKDDEIIVEYMLNKPWEWLEINQKYFSLPLFALIWVPGLGP